MINSINFINGDKIFINNINNNLTNKNYENKLINEIKKNLENHNLIIIDKNKLNKTKLILSISSNDTLNNLSKTIYFARLLKTKYIIFFKIKNKKQKLSIEMQLISTNNGEIIWNFKD